MRDSGNSDTPVTTGMSKTAKELIGGAKPKKKKKKWTAKHRKNFAKAIAQRGRTKKKPKAKAIKPKKTTAKKKAGLDSMIDWSKEKKGGIPLDAIPSRPTKPKKKYVPKAVQASNLREQLALELIRAAVMLLGKTKVQP